MAKTKNQRIYSDDFQFLKRLADEMEFIGREYRLVLDEGMLIIFALPQRKKKTKKENDKHERSKRAEKHSRS